jgi:hypothetical protein
MALTSQKSTIPTQAGSWYLITDGAWAGYWILEGPGIDLSDP